jgi:small subunit ribosomal protein S24e
MKIAIKSRKRNPLLKRREVVLEVDHKETGSTPPRLEVRKELATVLKSDLELVYVKRLETGTGTMIAVGEANVYDSVADAQLVEPKHIIARNVVPEKPEEEATEELEGRTKEKPSDDTEEAAEKVETERTEGSSE